MIPCHAPFVVTTRICGQHRHCIREQHHAGFCMALYDGWPFYWLSSTATPIP